MKKKILSFMAVIVLTFSVFMTAVADEGDDPAQKQGTAAELKSYGAIVYQKGSDNIRIDSQDLYALAEQIDQVKLEVVNQLKAMNTYFTASEGITLNTSEDINVVHAEPYEEDFVDPLEVNFDTLLEGIAVSQTISSEISEYGYPEGTQLYRTKDGKLTDTFVSGAQEITIASATADNLSAGMAAWVDGNLILGNGEENQDYYKTGYDEAYTKLSNQLASVDFIQLAGDLRTRKDDHSYLGAKDVSLPNKDVWILITGGVGAIQTISPAPNYKYDGYMMMLLQYRKNPNLPDSATRSVHFSGGRVGGGIGVPYWIIYLK